MKCLAGFSFLLLASASLRAQDFVDYYQVLAVPSSASSDQIEGAYQVHRALGSLQGGRYEYLEEAHSALEDPWRRFEYDLKWYAHYSLANPNLGDSNFKPDENISPLRGTNIKYRRKDDPPLSAEVNAAIKSQLEVFKTDKLSPLQEEVVNSVILLERLYNVALDELWAYRIVEANPEQLEFFLDSLRGLESALWQSHTFSLPNDRNRRNRAYAKEKIKLARTAIEKFKEWEKVLGEPVLANDLRYLEYLEGETYASDDFREAVFNLFLARKGGMPSRVAQLIFFKLGTMDAEGNKIEPYYMNGYMEAFSLAVSRVKNEAQFEFLAKIIDYFLYYRPIAGALVDELKEVSHSATSLVNSELAREVIRRISDVDASTDVEKLIHILGKGPPQNQNYPQSTQGSVSRTRDLFILDEFFQGSVPSACAKHLVKKVLDRASNSVR